MLTALRRYARETLSTCALGLSAEAVGLGLLRGLNKEPADAEMAVFWMEACAQFTQTHSTSRAAKKLARVGNRLTFGSARFEKKVRAAYATAMQDVLKHLLNLRFPDLVRSVTVDAPTVLTSELTIWHSADGEQSVREDVANYLTAILMASIGETFIEQLQARGHHLNILLPQCVEDATLAGLGVPENA